MENRNRDQVRRIEAKELLRSRPVQMLLTAVAIGQGFAITNRAPAESSMTLPPVTVASPMLPTSSAAIATTRTEAETKLDAELATKAEAEALAERYSRDGYRVSPELARAIHQAAQEYEISPETAFGLVRAESGFRTSATSPVGAVGLTQLMPKTASWLQPGVTRAQLRDPDTNLRIGFRYLRNLIDKYEGNERLALVAYNRGPGTVDRAIKRGRNPDNGYADFVYGKKDHGHKLFTR